MIYLKMNCSPYSCGDNDQEAIVFKNRPNWPKATNTEIKLFRDDVIRGLSLINLPDTALCCRNLQCQDEDHIMKLDEFTYSVLSVLEQSVDSNIPRVLNGKGVAKIPGWSDIMKPLRDQMNFWKFLWLSSGKTVNTQVHIVYRKLRHRYHYTINHLKKFKQEIKSNNFIQAAAEGKFNDILKSLRIQRNGKTMSSHTIDNITGEKDIAEHFSDIYEGIYNHHNEVDFITLANGVNEKVSELDNYSISKVTPECMNRLIGKVNTGKNDEHFSFKSDAYKYSRDIIAEPISRIFQAMLTHHGHFPNIFLFNTLIPIVKNNLKS